MKKKRAVAYVRVSSGSDAQIHSYEFQEHYWQERFVDDEEYELVGIYADKGISGKSMYRRPRFLAMIKDAKEGKFDAIFTKSVSRLGRNTTQVLETIGELRDRGIGVFFEKENIDTLNPNSQLYLTIAASIAENDLCVDAARQRWSIQHRCENGWVTVGTGLYGYRMVDGKLIVEPSEAEIVRKVYEMYIGGAGATMIAKFLNNLGVKTSRDKEWKPGTVLGLISNEKYMGDSMMGKSVYIDGIKHDNMNGEYGERYYTPDTHEGIVSKETWQRAQEIRQQRENPKLIGQESPVYTFTSKIRCGQCGAHYQHKVNNSGKKWQNDIWCCATSLRKGVAACNCTRIKDSVLREKFVEAYNEFVTKRPVGTQIEELQEEIERLMNEDSDLAELVIKRLITRSAYAEEQRAIYQRILEVRERIADISGRELTEQDYTIITEFDDEKAAKFIMEIVITKNVVTFVFCNGVEISRNYTNGQAGNKPGLNKKG